MTAIGGRLLSVARDVVSMSPTLIEFQAESNRIEGILRVRQGEVEALYALLAEEQMSVAAVVAYVAVVQPNAVLRDRHEVPGVRVGRHIAPRSGPRIHEDLRLLLDLANGGTISAHEAHCRYETLHPFTDGNGRSGRALWLWMHRGEAPLGFLRMFYYETLDALQSRT